MSGPNWLLSACTGHLRTAGKSGGSVPDRRAKERAFLCLWTELPRYKCSHKSSMQS